MKQFTQRLNHCCRILLFYFLFWQPVFGQEVSPSAPTIEEKAVLQDNLWTSARAAGTGGALAGLSDGMDSPYYNPATIGGLHLEKKQSKKGLRYIGFPYIGAAVGENSLNLNSDFASTPGAGDDPVVTQMILDAHEGSRQYARLSIVPSFLISRFMVTYVYDHQTAAISLGSGQDLIRAEHRVTTGPGFGFSATDPKGTLYFGAFAASLERTQVSGDFSFNQINTSETREQVISDARKRYVGTSANVGMVWKIAEKGRPSVALVSRDTGDTKFVPKNADDEEVVVKENVALAFTISPKLGKWGFFSFTLEGDHLTDNEMSVEKKAKVGMEFTVGGLFGNSSGFGIRSGYNNAGASYGAHANLGLLGIQFSSYAEDIGLDNKQIIERRYVGIASVNVAH